MEILNSVGFKTSDLKYSLEFFIFIFFNLCNYCNKIYIRKNRVSKKDNFLLKIVQWGYLFDFF